MRLKKIKVKDKFKSIITSVSSIVIPFFQYVPCTSVWFGIMSVPIITYISLFLQNPDIMYSDIRFLFSNHGIYFILGGLILFFYALIYQLTHRKQLLQGGPYKYIRHPQYLAFIIITLGMTIIAFQTDPIINFNSYYLNDYVILLYIWIGEVVAYIILAKIEEIALKSKYGNAYLNYMYNVPFMLPFLSSKRREYKNLES